MFAIAGLSSEITPLIVVINGFDVPDIGAVHDGGSALGERRR